HVALMFDSSSTPPSERWRFFTGQFLGTGKGKPVPYRLKGWGGRALSSAGRALPKTAQGMGRDDVRWRGSGKGRVVPEAGAAFHPAGRCGQGRGDGGRG